MLIAGIDPGLKGGIAVLDDRTVIVAEPLPIMQSEIDVKAIASLLLDPRPQLVVIERQQAMPKQGVSSTFKIGRNYGLLLGALQVLGYPVIEVRPHRWKQVVLRGQPKGKEAAIAFVSKRYPEVDLRPGRCRKPHDGIADAVCIAAYGTKDLKDAN
jgi:crossover junction endodeoxyribonuclease RuvC